jgi:hypothetical protein
MRPKPLSVKNAGGGHLTELTMLMKRQKIPFKMVGGEAID